MLRHFLVTTLLFGLVEVTAAAAESALPKYFFSHLAGPLGGPGTADGPGRDARFYYPIGVAVSGSGTIFVTDQSGNLLRKITPDGEVSSLVHITPNPGTEEMFRPMLSGTAVDKFGNVYVGDTGDHAILKIAPDLTVTLLAGAPAGEAGDADGLGSAARFNGPVGVTVDPAGNVYVADRNNHTVRKITPDGMVTTIAGVAGAFGHVDGIGAAARFNLPTGVAADGDGNVFVADEGDSTIRKIAPDGSVTTVAGGLGQGSADGTRTAAQFNMPRGVATGAGGNIYVADTNNNSVRKISPTGVVSTLAGTSGPDNIGSADGLGPAAQFHYPVGLAVDRDGNVYVTDIDNTAVRKITPAGMVSTFAGRAGGTGRADGKGTAARFCYPHGLAIDAANTVYVCDRNNQMIRKVTADGVVTTIAGAAQVTGSTDGLGSAARFNNPAGIAIDSAGTLFVADEYNHTIRKIAADGNVTTFAGKAGVAGSADGPGPDARFNEPNGLAFDGAGNLLVADALNSTVRRITPGGTVTTIAGTPKVYDSVDGIGSAAAFCGPSALAVDGAGNIYVADLYNYTIRKIAPNGQVTTVAGLAGVPGNTDGVGANARFAFPYGLAIDRDGNLLVVDGNSLVRRITPAGVVETLAGTPGVLGSVDGINRAAQFGYCLGIAVSRSGDIYLTDYTNCAIRRGQLAGPPTITAQPQSASVAPGAGVQFSVTATGVPSPTYQWYFNGSAIKDMTGDTLALAIARTADAGDYSVAVTNELGSVTSNKATLAVTAPPSPPPSTPTNPSGQVSGGSGGGGAFSPWFLAALAGATLVRWRTRH